MRFGFPYRPAVLITLFDLLGRHIPFLLLEIILQWMVMEASCPGEAFERGNPTCAPSGHNI
jgi:hypothetical protein